VNITGPSGVAHFWESYLVEKAQQLQTQVGVVLNSYEYFVWYSGVQVLLNKAVCIHFTPDVSHRRLYPGTGIARLKIAHSVT
jgi:hypothetical protein